MVARALTCLGILMLFTLHPASASAEPTEISIEFKRTTATVISVISTSALRVHAGNEEKIISLYGVEAPASTSPIGMKSKNDLSEVLRGEVIQFESWGNAGAYPEVIAYFDSGASVNEFIVASGLGAWNKSLAPDYLNLSEAEDSAKKDGKGIWRAFWTGPNNEEPSGAPTQDQLNAFKETAELKRVAFFDAAYERWIGMSDEEQMALFHSISGARQRVSASARSTIASLGKSASAVESAEASKRGEINASVTRLAELQAERKEAVKNVYDDRKLKFHQDRAQTLENQRQALLQNGVMPNRRFNAEVDAAHMKARQEEARVERRAQATRAEYEPVIDAENSAMTFAQREQLELATTAQVMRNRQEVAANLDSKVQLNAEATRAFLLQLAEAQNANYEPYSVKAPVAGIEGMDLSAQFEAKITARVWRIDCDDLSGIADSGLVVDIYKDGASKPFRRLTGDVPTFKRFLIVDEPGRFTFKIHNPVGIEYAVTVYEVAFL